MSEQGFTRASTLGPIGDVIKSSGANLDKVFRHAQLPLRLLNERQSPILLRDHFKLLALAAFELEDPWFGASLGSQIDLSGLGTYGILLVQEPTLYQALLQAGRRLAPLMQSATEIRLERHVDKAHFIYDVRDHAVLGREHNALLALAYMRRLVEAYLGKNWQPDYTQLQSQRLIGRLNTLEEVSHTQIVFDERAPRLIFDWKLVSCVRPDQQRPTLSARALADETAIPTQADFVSVVAALIDIEMLQGKPDLRRIGERLNMSSRTLQRKLQMLGNGFRQMVGAALQRHAVRLLGDEKLSITDVALELGYEDVAHFSRAFKNQTGFTPSQWLNLQRSM